MCSTIYVSSQKRLPEIEWDNNCPGFSIVSADLSEDSLIRQILQANYYYEADSFMGCSCGLAYGDWSLKTADNHEARLSDVKAFRDYLASNSRSNEIRIFSTGWDHFPEVYPEEDFQIPDPLPAEFDIPEYEILTVKF